MSVRLRSVLATCLPGFLWLILVISAGAGQVPAAELRPSWDCLPEATVAAVRMPQAADVLRAVRDRTKFGSTLLSAARLEKIQAAFAAAAEDSGVDEGLGDWLAKHGLSQDDLKAMAAGDMGLGLVMPPPDDGAPTARMLLGWLEPGVEQAGRLLAAVKQLQEESRDEPHPTKRVDLELAGREVLWLVSPLMRPDLAGLDLEADDGDKAAELQRQIAARVKEGKLVQYAESNLFLCLIDGRMLVGMSLPDAGGAGQVQLVAKDGNVGVTITGQPGGAGSGTNERDWEAQAESAKGIFERYLAAHGESGDSPLATALQTPGMQEVLPAGLPLMEMVLRPRTLLAALGKAEMWVPGQVGLDQLGPLAWRQSLDDGTMRSGIFIALPTPRSGLMEILDQPCDDAEIPSFATAETIDLTQISLDLGAVYTTVKQVATAGGNEQVQNMFNAAEAQTLGLIGAELPKLLSSLGSRHWIVSYPPRIAEALAAAKQARDAAPTSSRFALVWQVEDEAPFAKILQRLAPLAGGELQEEQGFRGLRLPSGAAISLGHRHLLLTVGDDTLEKTMAAVRNPPAAAASLRESDSVRRIRDLLPLPACRAFGISESSKTGGVLGAMRELVAGLAPEDVPDESRKLLAAVQPLLPSAAEMEGVFGVGGWTLEANDRGVAVRSVWEMPAP